MQLFPQLRKLEQKYADVLAVIGVHSPKFPAERELATVRESAKRYEIEHPIVNDPDHKVWRSYGVRAWPSLLFIDPEGKAVGRHEGEIPFDVADRLLGEMVAEYDSLGLLDRSPLDLGTIERAPSSVLAFPAKIVADAATSRLFVSDSNHNRVVVCSLDGRVTRVFGDGSTGFEDGEVSLASFDHPQGLALAGDLLYVADTGNHAVRAIDLTAGRVSTVAGTGIQGLQRSAGGVALRTSLASPWDLAWSDGVLYVAMAGFHQIWAYRPATGEIGVYAGAGDEGLRDGPRQGAALAQTNGLALSGGRIYLADSETSAIRLIDETNQISTLVGTGLFDFGDRDGTGAEVLLQHPQAICESEGLLYFCDTYNNKVKRLDPSTRRCTTLAGSSVAGYADGAANEARFNEPAGIAVLGDRLYVADTNNHAIRLVEIATGQVSTLAVSGG